MLRDVQYAFRMLRKNPGFSAVAVCSLAIGIGANSAIYSIADGLILRPLPVAEPTKVVTIRPVSTGFLARSSSISYPDYIHLRDHNRSFECLIASSYASFGFKAEHTAQPQMKSGCSSRATCSAYWACPHVGRGMREDEDRLAGRDALSVLSHDLWVSDFGSNPAVLGRKFWLSGAEFTIIGVAPESFVGMDQLKPALFVPLTMSPNLMGPDFLTKRSKGWLDLRGRLKPRVGKAQAQAEMTSAAAELARTYPKSDEGLTLKVETEFQARVDRSPPEASWFVGRWRCRWSC